MIFFKSNANKQQSVKRREKIRSAEAMKRLTLLKNRSDKAFNTLSPPFIASLLHCRQQYLSSC
jgi:hypothetical protein